MHPCIHTYINLADIYNLFIYNPYAAFIKCKTRYKDQLMTVFIKLELFACAR